MMELAGLAWAVLIGYLAVRLLGPARSLHPRWAAVLLEVTLGVGAGAALTGLLFIVLLAVGASGRWMVFGIETATLVALAILNLRRQPSGPPPSQQEPSIKWRWNGIVAVILVLTAVVAFLSQVDTVRTNPSGEFDALAIWNVRAKLLLGPGETWQRAFSPMLVRQHPNYPLLLPAFVARTWRIGGDQSTGVGSFGAGALFYWSAFGLLLSALILLRGLSSGLLGCVVLFSAISFLEQSAWQYADIPLSLYFQSALSLLLLSASAEGRRRTTLLAMSGAFAACSAMIKDEGAPFVLIVPVVYGVLRWREGGLREAWRDVRPWMAGALPGVALEAWFKLGIAPRGGPFAGPTLTQALDHITDPSRYATVVSYLFTKAGSLGGSFAHPLLLLLILGVALRFDANPSRKTQTLTAGFVLAVLLLSYCGVYVVSLNDIEWQLSTSLHRLYSQIFPSFLFFVFLLLGVAGDPLQAEPKRATEPKKKRKR